MKVCEGCIYDLCDVFVCNGEAVVSFPLIEASDNGYYDIVLEYQSVLLVTSAMFAVGEKLSFDLFKLNSNYCYQGYILDHSGQRIEWESDGIVYNRFKFCTHPIHNI
jgi:hypothetical protein